MLAVVRSVHPTVRLLGVRACYPQLSLVECLASSSSAQSSPLLKKQCRPPFIIFSADKITDLRRSHPGSRITDLSKMLGQMWKVLPDEQKEVYRVRYQDEREVFLAKRKTLLDNMTEEEKNQLQEEEDLKKKRSAIRSERKLKKRLNKPVAADINPFILFFKSKILERGDAPISQYMKGVSEHWKRMPVEDKQPFVDKAKQNSIDYQRRLAAWEHKMVAEGHSSLLRRAVYRKLTSRRNVTKLALTKNTGRTKRTKNTQPSVESKTPVIKSSVKSSDKSTSVSPASKSSTSPLDKTSERGTNKMTEKKINK